MRAGAPFLLPEIARELGEDPFADRFDAEAIARVESDEGDVWCAEYLVAVRGDRLTAAACERLLRSTSPLARVLGHAVSKQWGHAIDGTTLRTDRDALSPTQAVIAASALRCLDSEYRER